MFAYVALYPTSKMRSIIYNDTFEITVIWKYSINIEQEMNKLLLLNELVGGDRAPNLLLAKQICYPLHHSGVDNEDTDKVLVHIVSMSSLCANRILSTPGWCSG